MSLKDVFLDENLQVFVCEVDTELVKGVGGQLVVFCGPEEINETSEGGKILEILKNVFQNGDG